MDIETVLGITWYKATASDIILLAAILMIPVSLVILLRIRQKLQNMRIQEEHLFLFKLKRLGLSNFQIKIVNTIVQILKLSSPKQLLEKPELFEKAIGRFLTHIRESGETEETQCIICRDITTIYDKLYFNTRFKKPLKGIQDVDGEQLIYFSPVPDKVFIGKIISRDDAYLFITIFGNTGDLAAIPEKKSATFHLFRVGDAEYEFISPIDGWDKTLLKVKQPDKLVMREEARHPYIDVIIPARITREEMIPKELEAAAGKEIAESDQTGEKITDKQEVIVEEVKDEMPCTIYKINDYEAVLRVSQKLDYRHRYILEFKVMDFAIKIITRLIATKTVVESDSFFYTVKYDEMSESASNVLKKFVHEHL
jgi:hypothetical protein